MADSNEMINVQVQTSLEEMQAYRQKNLPTNLTILQGEKARYSSEDLVALATGPYERQLRRDHDKLQDRIRSLEDDRKVLWEKLQENLQPAVEDCVGLEEIDETTKDFFDSLGYGYTKDFKCEINADKLLSKNVKSITATVTYSFQRVGRYGSESISRSWEYALADLRIYLDSDTNKLIDQLREIDDTKAALRKEVALCQRLISRLPELAKQSREMIIAKNTETDTHATAMVGDLRKFLAQELGVQEVNATPTDDKTVVAVASVSDTSATTAETKAPKSSGRSRRKK